MHLVIYVPMVLLVFGGVACVCVSAHCLGHIFRCEKPMYMTSGFWNKFSGDTTVLPETVPSRF